MKKDANLKSSCGRENKSRTQKDAAGEKTSREPRKDVAGEKTSREPKRMRRARKQVANPETQVANPETQVANTKYCGDTPQDPISLLLQQKIDKRCVQRHKGLCLNNKKLYTTRLVSWCRVLVYVCSIHYTQFASC